MPSLYAIGDVHGRRDHLAVLLDAIRADAAAREEQPRIVFLGDVIDRGPESRQAMELVIDTLARYPGSAMILGNHEEFMLRFIEPSGDRDRVGLQWFRNGGLAAIASYGFGEGERVDEIADAFRERFPDHVALLRNAAWKVETERYFLVHGGIDPMLSLAGQDPEVTRWIRGEFLDYRGGLEKIVVHGHTPTDSQLPELRGNRIAIDTGAYFSGHLTCAVLDDNEPPRFLATDDHGQTLRAAPIRPLIFY